MRLTEEGRAYFEHDSRALEVARDAGSVVLSAKATPRGVLRVTTAAALAAHVLDAVIARYPALPSRVRSFGTHVPVMVLPGIDPQHPAEVASLYTEHLRHPTLVEQTAPDMLERLSQFCIELDS